MIDLGISFIVDDVFIECVYGLRKDSFLFESVMENYRKSCFVLWLNILKIFVDLSCYSCDKKFLRVGCIDGLDMFVDGYFVKNFVFELVWVDLK